MSATRLRRLASLCGLLAACSAGGAPETPAAAAALEGVGELGRYRFGLTLHPARPAVGRLFAVETVAVEAETGRPAELEALSVDATMPDHGHGMQTAPRHRPVEPGRWRTEGMKLHMPGRWVLEVRARGPGGEDRLRLVLDQPPG